MKLMKYEEWIDSIHRADGISEQTENEIRKDIVSFMIIFGENADMENSAIAKAIFIFHKYSKAVSFKKFNVLLYAVACIFIAAKFEDKPLKLTFATRLYLTMGAIYQRIRIFYPMGLRDLVPSDFQLSFLKELKLDPIVLDHASEGLLEAETDVLSQIGYELDIELPYSYINQLEAKNLMLDESFLDIVKALINKSWRTTLCLYFEPKVIVLGAMNHAQFVGRTLLRETKLGNDWMEVFGDIHEEEVIEVTKYLKELK